MTGTPDEPDMEIALLGGTGDIGKGLALRWAHDTDHEIVVGSRKEEKARRLADEYVETLADLGRDRSVAGLGNEAAADGADVVVVSVPPEYAPSTTEAVADSLDDDAILVSPAVNMDRDAAGFHYEPPEGFDSVAAAIEAAAPDHVPVVGAFQNLAAGALSDLENDLQADVIVTGTDEDAKDTVRDVATDIEGIRALDGGPLATTALVESITPLLINLAMNNDGMHDLGVKFQ